MRRCFRLYLLLTSIPRLTFYRSGFGPPGITSRITSATSDVLANFSRLSIFISHVKLYFAFVEIFSLNQSSRLTCISHSAKKYQNNHDARKRARSTQLLIQTQIKLQWLGFGLLVGPSGSQPHQTLGLRSVIPLLTDQCCLGQGEEQCFAVFLCYSLRISCFSLLCKLLPTALRLLEVISQFTAVQHSSPVDNR